MWLRNATSNSQFWHLAVVLVLLFVVTLLTDVAMTIDGLRAASLDWNCVGTFCGVWGAAASGDLFAAT